MEDKKQTEAIMHGNGPCLVLAGPGSGKTYVLTHHIFYLINSVGVSPENILVITFTKEAKKEMKSRCLALDENNGERVTFGTFHSVFFALLRHWFDKNVKIIDEEKKRLYLAKISGTEEGLDSLVNDISRYKSGVVTECEMSGIWKRTLDITEEYNALLSSRNELDYDDILIKCLEMFENNPNLAKKAGERFKYILIDEFQDINEIQYRVIKNISLPPFNIFAVGDDDQAIYAFRGANREIMKRFLTDYKDVKVISLAHNYRSHADIIRAAFAVISDNTGRLKNSVQVCGNNEAGRHFYLEVCNEKEDEYCLFKKLAGECLSMGMSVAVLSRTNNNAMLYKKLFNEEGIEKADREKLTVLVSRDISAYYGFCKKETGNGLLAILNRPERFIESAIVNSGFESLSKLMEDTKNIRIKNELSVMQRHLSMLRNCTPKAFCLYLFNIVGYKNFLIEKFPGDEAKVVFVMSAFVRLAADSSSMEDFVQKLPIIGQGKKSPINCKGINFLTFHASKGLEFDAVFIPDVLEGNIPGRNADLTAEVEEERRLFYVAMTRARKRLYLLTIKNEGSGKYLPSRFIRKLL